MDETYRRFHSGRFGMSSVDGSIYQTQLEDSKGVTPLKKKKKDDDEESNESSDVDTSSAGEDPYG